MAKVRTSSAAAAAVSPDMDLSEEDSLRAQFYKFLARFLAAPPDDWVLNFAANLQGDETPLGQALNSLARIAAKTAPAVARNEYHVLFIGLGRGELVPFGSYYLTGFLNEKPLAKLRGDMAALGLARADHVKEPEDHIASLCEIMAGLITGEFGCARTLEEQRAFFRAHLLPWAGRFFENLEAAESAVLYAPVGTLGRLFIAVEETAFEMEA
ncbi:molecular chaperone TorD family protein [Rhodospirillaceae bacterium SYSU D60014]|uniref:TorD/DmsD family molecular chaperone n=1 Tax=Virgifigura deserti TaxID=2268457 RepID=UPI000E67507C